jgi:hypothetical protein
VRGRLGFIVLAAAMVSACITINQGPGATPTSSEIAFPTIPPLSLPPLPTVPPLPLITLPPIPTLALEPTDTPATETAEPGTPEPTLAPGETPPATPIDLLPFLTSGITLYNLGDSTLYVSATIIDTGTGDEYPVGDLSVEADQFTRQASLATRYRIDFSYDRSTNDALGSCTIDVSDADEIDFTAVPDGIIITKNAQQPNDPAEMVVATSSLCQAGSAP